MEKYLYVYELVEVMSNVFDEIPFPDPNDKPLEIADFTYSAIRHDVPMISATINSPTSLQGKWNHKQVVTFRNTKFYITEIPSLKHDNVNDYERYEVQMYPEWYIVKKTLFYDVVDSDAVDTSEKYFSNSTNVTFFGTLTEFISRINASFKHSKLDYVAKIADSLVGSDIVNEVKEYIGDNMTLLDAMKKAFDVWKVPFYMDSELNCFVFGYFKNDIDTILRYGYDKELLSVEQNNARNNIITRATGVGSSQNLPYYYPNDTEKGDIDFVMYDERDNVLQEGDPYQLIDKNKLINSVEDGRLYIYKKDTTLSFLELVKAQYKFDNYGESGWTMDGIIDHPQSTEKEPGVSNTFYLTLSEYTTKDDIFLSVRIYFKVSKSGKYKIDLDAEGGYPTIGDFGDGGRTTARLIDCYDEAFVPKWTNDTEDIYVKREWLGGYDSLDFEINDTSHIYCVEFLNSNVSKAIEANKIVADKVDNKIVYEILFNVNLWEYNKEKVRYKWYKAQSEYPYNLISEAPFDKLRDIGVAYDESYERETAEGKVTKVRENFKFAAKVMETHPYQTRLMPSIFTRGKAFHITDDTTDYYSVTAESKDTERYYNATDNTYPTGDLGFIKFPTPYNGKNRSEAMYEYDDIKPEIKGVRNSLGQLIGEIASVAYDYDDNDFVNEGGDDSTSYKHPYFYVKLHRTDSPNDMGFNLFDYALASEPVTLQITSGALAGCSFKVQVAEVEPNVFRNPVLTDTSGELLTMTVNGKDVISQQSCITANTNKFVSWQQDTTKNEVWIALLKEDSTFGVIMPNKGNKLWLKEGDTFNIININLPKEYILQAEQRLDEAIVNDMLKYNAEQFNFAIDFSRIYLAENYNENELKNKAGIYSLLDESSRILVYIGKDTAVYQYVESYTYECKASEMLPKISLGLTNSIVKKESIAETLAKKETTSQNVWRELVNKSTSAIHTGTKLSDYGITDVYISNDGEIVIGNRSIKPVTSTSTIMAAPGFPSMTNIWAELTKVDSTKVIDDSHISENIARRDDLKWRNVTED